MKEGGLVGGDQIIQMKNFADARNIFYNSPEWGAIFKYRATSVFINRAELRTC